jgi:uridine kinase
VGYYPDFDIILSMNNLKSICRKIKSLAWSKKGPVLVAIDGRSGAGKSTIAKKLKEEVGGVIVMGDDFYSGGSNEEWNKLTPKEKVERCIDWKRLRKEVLELLLFGKSANWYPFDFIKGNGLSEKVLKADPSKIIFLDGAYSSRPELDDLIDITILVEADDKKRRAVLVQREGIAFMNNWHKVWDVAEDYYFANVRPKESFDFDIQNKHDE